MSKGSSLITLRDYQDDTHVALREAYDKGLNRLLVHYATGLGKTGAVAAFLPQTFPELEKHGLIFISHRREILYHAYQSFKKMWGNDKWIGLEMGEYHATGHEDFLFVSVDSIGRIMGNRIDKFRHRYPGIIVVDEGHHVTKDGTWDNILNYFGVGSNKTQHHTFASGDKPLSVFLTATPQRQDGQALSPFVDEVVISLDIRFGMREGWLTDIKAYRPEFGGVDYKELDADDQVNFLIKTWKEYSAGTRTLAFARSVAQSELLAGTLNKYGMVRAAHVDANTDTDIRQQIVRDFSRSYDDPEAIEFLTNRLIFTEGYDNQLIQTILDNAPTESLPLYQQKIGRGLRPHSSLDLGSYKTARGRKEAIRKSDKPHLIYITTFPLNHGLDMPATLFGVPKGVQMKGRMVSEVVDLIKYEEEIMPEAPTRDLAGLDDIEITMKRQDIWTQTVYNEDLKALSNLRWSMGKNFAAIRLFKNPWATTANEETPVILALTKTDGQWAFDRIIEGGYVEKMRRAVRAQILPKPRFYKKYDDMNVAIRGMDKWLAKIAPDVTSDLQRAHSGAANDRIIKYLKTKKVPANYANLTQETAQILKDDIRIRPKMEKFNLPTD